MNTIIFLVPTFKEFYPKMSNSYGTKKVNFSYIDFDGKENFLELQSTTKELFGKHVTIIERHKKDGSGKLNIYSLNENNLLTNHMSHVSLQDCYYHYKSSDTLAAISYCDDTVV